MTPTPVSTPSATFVAWCPAWCSSRHGELAGEEDWIHESDPVPLAEGMQARLRMSIEPSTGLEDGPFIVIGSTEYTVDDAEALGESLSALAAMGRTS